MRSTAFLLARLDAPQAREKYGALKELAALAETAPERVYPCFDEIAALLRHNNHILRWNASRILGSLARADTEGRLEEMLDEYLAPIQGPRMIGAANVVNTLPVIARAKPHLAAALVEAILTVRHARYETEECHNVAMGHASNALAAMRGLIPDKAVVRKFLRKAAENPRNATRRKAERALRLLDA